MSPVTSIASGIKGTYVQLKQTILVKFRID